MGLRVRMLRRHPANLRDGRRYAEPGEVMELADGDLGDDLLHPRREPPYAELVTTPPLETVAVEPPQRAVKRTRKPTPRKAV